MILACLIIQSVTLALLVAAFALLYWKHGQLLTDIKQQLHMEMDLLKPPEPLIVEQEELPPVDPKQSLFTPAESARYNTDSYLAAVEGIDLEK